MVMVRPGNAGVRAARASRARNRRHNPDDVDEDRRNEKEKRPRESFPARAAFVAACVANERHWTG